MAMTYATISGTITQPGTSVGIRARVTATPMTTNHALTFPGEDRVTWGPQTAETGSNGVLALLKVPTNHGMPELYWRINVERIDPVRGQPKRWTMGVYEITANVNVADLVEIDTMVVDAAVLVNLSDLLADAEAARDDAESAALESEDSKDAAAASAAAADAARDDLLAQKGAASGIAPLDGGQLVPQANLPAHLTTVALAASIAEQVDPVRAAANAATGLALIF